MGRFTLRLPETLHHDLEVRAEQEGVSLNQYIVYALTRQTSSRYTMQTVPPESVREQRARYDALLNRLGEPSPEATEAFLAEREPTEPETGLTPDVVERVREKIRRAAG